MTFYKVLDGYQPTNGGSGRYPGVGRWTRHLNPETLVACRVGYHVVKDVQVLDWLGPTIYEAEPCNQHPPVDGGDKWVTCRVRLTRKLNWDDRTARLFAADCAKAALLGERGSGREPDERSWTAIEVAIRFAEGDATVNELAAAGAAAWAAARDAARDAVWAAARAVDGAAAGAAARAAAWPAAGDAAGDAVWDAAWAAVTKDLVGTSGYTRAHYDLLVAPMVAVFGDDWDVLT